MDVNFLHPSKALSPILVTPLPIITDDKDVQAKKALFPILVTRLPIITDVNLLHP